LVLDNTLFIKKYSRLHKLAPAVSCGLCTFLCSIFRQVGPTPTRISRQQLIQDSTTATTSITDRIRIVTYEEIFKIFVVLLGRRRLIEKRFTE